MPSGFSTKGWVRTVVAVRVDREAARARAFVARARVLPAQHRCVWV